MFFEIIQMPEQPDELGYTYAFHISFFFDVTIP